MGHDICLLSAFWRFHPAEVWIPLSWSWAALSLNPKYLSLRRITGNACSRYLQATQCRHPTPSPGLRHPCHAQPVLLCALFRRSLDISEPLCEISCKPGSLGFGNMYILFYFLFLASHLNWGFQWPYCSFWGVSFKRVCELSSFNKQVLGCGGI